MATKSKYGQLNIDREQLYTTLIAFFIEKGEEYSCTEIIHVSGPRNRFEYKFNTVSEKIDFHFNRDGSTTIDLSPGGISELKEEVAEFIYNSPICQNKEISKLSNPWFVFDNIATEEFEVIIGLLEEIEGVEKSEKKIISGGELVEINSSSGEKIKISYFTKNRKLMVQGRPLKLFSEAYTFTMTLIDTEQIPDIMSQQLNVKTEVTSDSIEKELMTYLSNLELDTFPVKMKKLSYQAIMNLKIQLEMFDYAFLAFPSLRLIEGHLKYIMKNKRIRLESDKFSMFTCVGTTNNRTYVLQTEYNNLFTLNEKNYVERAYNYYKNNRHSLFHWGNLDTPLNVDRTRMINRLDEAHGCIYDVFEVINGYYK